jgi:tagatose-6-phosphate ketose/aldose isomerase
MTIEADHLHNPLAKLVNLESQEKTSRGLMHTPQEIWQQPATWINTFLRVSERAEQLHRFLVKSLSEQATVYLIGAGTSDYVGRTLTSVLREKWHCNVIAVPSTDMITEMESYTSLGKPGLWISFSRSGDSSEGVGVLERALREYPEVRHLVVGCNRNGKMLQMCEGLEKAFTLVLDDAVNDRGLAMTSSFTNMVVAGQCIANLSSLAEYRSTLDALVDMGSRMLEQAAPIAESISRANCRKAVFVGSGSLAAVATECALKSLELTAGSIHTMSESVMGLRHGPMSAMDEETLFVSFLSSAPSRLRYEVDLLREVQEKGLGRVRVAIAPVSIDGLPSLCNHAIVLGAPLGFSDDYLAPVDVIFGQVFGLFASINAGLQPDQPSPDGTISRVVSHVKLY